MKYDKKYVRNFSIIAHIDHGKSTLADRLIEETGMLTHREMSEQVLDSMDLERERGITIKLKAMKLFYKAKDGSVYVLNLIDIPGHVDFTYEVSRSLEACEGAILTVDATQDVGAQTLGNVYLAIDQDLEILPVINKIDLPSVDIDFAKREIEDIIGLDAENVPAVSAKEGIDIVDVLEDIINNVPAPIGDGNKSLKALTFGSYYDFYKSVVVYVRVFDGCIKPGSEILMMSTNKTFKVTECGYTSSRMISTDKISAGDVGYVVCSIKNVKDARVGDTITDKNNPVDKPLGGYKQVTPMVYCGIYLAEGEDFNSVRGALEKLQVNDAVLTSENETSITLGFRLRYGFLGLLHMETIQERLDREFDLDIIATAPGVAYKVRKKDGTEIEIQDPTNFPKETEVNYAKEPVVHAETMTPTDYVGVIMELCQGKRGTFIDMTHPDEKRVTIKYGLPLDEVIYDFYDALRSRTKDYASLDYELIGYEKSNLIKLEMMINSEKINALTIIVHEDLAYERARKIVTKLKDEIPRYQLVIPVQTAIGDKIIARETIRAYRKDVLAKYYGGDITRKRKLLEKQKEGEKRMRSVGSVNVPQEALLSVLRYGEGS